MHPTAFPQVNATYAETQQEYLLLPVHRSSDGVVTSCWKLSFVERLQVLFYGKVYVQLLTFGRPLQPQKVLTSNPIEQTDGLI